MLRWTSRPFFDSEDDVTTIEDLAILQDLDAADEEWALIRRQRYPAKTYANGDTKLTVILANKLPLERQLGVDLVYVNETLKSVVFVQYKMFTGEDGEGGYRPDGQLTTEIGRMDEAAAKIATVPVDMSCAGYRFAPDAFFLKFCKKLLTHKGGRACPGLLCSSKLLEAVGGVAGRQGRKGRDCHLSRYAWSPLLQPDRFHRSSCAWVDRDIGAADRHFSALSAGRTERKEGLGSRSSV